MSGMSSDQSPAPSVWPTVDRTDVDAGVRVRCLANTGAWPRASGSSVYAQAPVPQPKVVPPHLHRGSTPEELSEPAIRCRHHLVGGPARSVRRCRCARTAPWTRSRTPSWQDPVDVPASLRRTPRADQRGNSGHPSRGRPAPARSGRRGWARRPVGPSAGGPSYRSGRASTISTLAPAAGVATVSSGYPCQLLFDRCQRSDTVEGQRQRTRRCDISRVSFWPRMPPVRRFRPAEPGWSACWHGGPRPGRARRTTGGAGAAPGAPAARPRRTPRGRLIKLSAVVATCSGSPSGRQWPR